MVLLALKAHFKPIGLDLEPKDFSWMCSLSLRVENLQMVDRKPVPEPSN